MIRPNYLKDLQSIYNYSIILIVTLMWHWNTRYQYQVQYELARLSNFSDPHAKKESSYVMYVVNSTYPRVFRGLTHIKYVVL